MSTNELNLELARLGGYLDDSTLSREVESNYTWRGKFSGCSFDGMVPDFLNDHRAAHILVNMIITTDKLKVWFGTQMRKSCPTEFELVQADPRVKSIALLFMRKKGLL